MPKSVGSPLFLYRGITLATLRLDGKTPLVKDWLIAIVSMGEISVDTALRMTEEIPSGPALGLGGKLPISFSMVSALTRWKENLLVALGPR